MRYLTFIFVFTCLHPAEAQTLTNKEKQILKAIDKNYNESLVFLEKTVNINSGTHNLTGVREVGKIFGQEFAKIGFHSQWIPMPEEMKRAGHLFAERKGSKGKRLLLIGHLDTVFEPDSPFQSWTAQDSIATGPGVNDMKGGNVIILYALKALEETGALKDAQVIVALHGDEESSGTPVEISRKDIIEAAKQSDLALAFETGTGFGYATVARRGSSQWQLEVEGRQAHSSMIFTGEVGAGAIFEASRILKQFYDSLQEQYLTFSPGVIAGGGTAEISSAGLASASGKTNIVADKVLVTGDLRFISEEQKEKARLKMKAIVAQHLPKTNATITFKDGIPAMPPANGNYELLAYLNKVSLDMGLGKVEPWDPGKRGAGDISYVASIIPGLDGLGAIGTGSHAPGETIDLGSFKDMTARTAIFIYRLINEKR